MLVWCLLCCVRAHLMAQMRCCTDEHESINLMRWCQQPAQEAHVCCNQIFVWNTYLEGWTVKLFYFIFIFCALARLLCLNSTHTYWHISETQSTENLQAGTVTGKGPSAFFQCQEHRAAFACKCEHMEMSMSRQGRAEQRSAREQGLRPAPQWREGGETGDG